MTGSAHDARAFEHTAAATTPDWLFDGEEFAWADSAYTANARTIPVHKRPASLLPENALFDKTVAHLRVRSEHCMGALKGRFQCLRGLRVDINTKVDHVAACRWITIAIIIHNLIIDVEGADSVQEFLPLHSREQELDDRGNSHATVEDGDPEAKRMQLIQEIVAYQDLR